MNEGICGNPPPQQQMAQIKSCLASQCWGEVRVAPLNTLSFVGSSNLRSDDKRRFFRERRWQAYLETVKGAIILHGKNVVRDRKDVALGGYKASQVYCFNCTDRAEEREEYLASCQSAGFLSWNVSQEGRKATGNQLFSPSDNCMIDWLID